MTFTQKLKFFLKFPKRIMPIVFLNKIGFQLQINENIRDLCKGECIEVGAYSKPAVLPYATSIRYADIHTVDEAKKTLEKRNNFRYHRAKFVEVDIIFKNNEPPLTSLEDNSVDTVFSNQSLEHSSNPIAALMDYIRVIKKGGIVYTVIPNKNFTYDVNRKTTPVSKLIDKYKTNNWEFTLDEFEELIQNSLDHDHFPDKSQEKIIEAFEENDGTNHIYCFDEDSSLELISFLYSQVKIKLVLFDATSKSNIHFAIKKI